MLTDCWRKTRPRARSSVPSDRYITLIKMKAMSSVLVSIMQKRRSFSLVAPEVSEPHTAQASCTPAQITSKKTRPTWAGFEPALPKEQDF
jgi:hypothetical protein